MECLGVILEKYGIYELNGIVFLDIEEIWWLEIIGGYYWIVCCVFDDVYVINFN